MKDDTILFQFHDQQDVTDELMTYRIETKAYEVIVAGGRDFGAVVVQKKDKNKTGRR